MKKKVLLSIILIVTILLAIGCAGIYFSRPEEIASIEDKAKEVKAVTSTADVVGTWDVSATESDSVTATLYSSGKLIVSGTGNMKDYASYNRPYDYDEIKTVEIQKGVTNIGRYTFYGCSNLTGIEISNSVTSIGNCALESCSSLKSIEIPSSVTSIGWYAFAFCSSLTSIEIPNSVTDIGAAAFHECTSLISIDIPSSVTSIGLEAFSQCTSLTSIKIPSSVTDIGTDAFLKCYNLTIYGEKDTKAEEYAKANEKSYINIYKAQAKTTLENFNKNLTINGTNTKIVDKNNNELNNTDLITTGTKMTTTINNEEVSYVILVAGDTNGDGQADLKDILTINKHRLKKVQLRDEYLFAGNLNDDGKTDIKDLLQINKFRLGKIDSL